jgi:transcriptional regulator with XRE-family HTH domain
MSDDNKKKLGERVRRARREADLTQDELAARLEVSQGVISNVETGVSTIDAPDLPRWARALGVPVMYFYLDYAADLPERAATLLGMFPPDRLEFVFQMLENMAQAMRGQENGSQPPVEG